ncbi:hypothetical protein ACFO9Q_05305 [Paenibacillus sp. GCM10023252]|uniref:hypothetical protein n=1 Tax=Paenibacillus sp. GCM10023252 TaxID=3252649 RepID=UPI00360FB662
MNGVRRRETTRRYKTGQWVPYDGLFSDGWGGDLILMEGEIFPAHPQAGATNWTYEGPVATIHLKPSKQDYYHMGY